MARRHARQKGRSAKKYIGPVNVLPKYLTDSDEMRALSAHACKLLLAVLPQFNGPGRNNGGILIVTRRPKQYGFKSVETLTAARDELLRCGFLQMTLQGGLNKASQYAFTWEPIDDLPGLEVRPDTKASDLWKRENAALRDVPPPRKRRKSKAAAPISGTRKITSSAPISGTHRHLIAPISGTRRPLTAPAIGAVEGSFPVAAAPISGTAL